MTRTSSSFSLAVLRISVARTSAYAVLSTIFIMVERTAYADVLATEIRRTARLKEEEVLVIHTDTKGNLTKNDLDAARDAARDVDKPGSAVKIIVSVLMLREGWDVRCL